LLTSPAYAGAKATPSADAGKGGSSKAPAKTFASEDAKRLYEAGLKHLDGNEGERALKEFDAALAFSDDLDIQFARARALQAVGRFSEAVSAFRKVRGPVAEAPAAEDRRAKALLREMDCLKNLFQVKVRGPKGAVLKVDGKEVAWSADDTVVLAPGSYQFSLEVSGAPVSRRLAGAGGETVEFGDGVAASNGGTAATGTGNNAGAGAGNGNGTKTPVPEEKSSSTGYIVGGSLVGVGALGLVGGVIFASKSNGKFSDAKAAPTAPGAEGLYNDARSAKTLSTVAYIGGAAFIAGGAAAFVFWPKPEKRTAVRVLPGILGASVVGEF
jgi:hypothetical protein